MTTIQKAKPRNKQCPILFELGIGVSVEGNAGICLNCKRNVCYFDTLEEKLTGKIYKVIMK